MCHSNTFFIIWINFVFVFMLLMLCSVPMKTVTDNNRQRPQGIWNLLGHILLWRCTLVFLVLDGLCSTQSASTTGSDETNLASSGCVPPDCWGLANMLMVTTTEGMLNRLENKQHRSGLKPAFRQQIRIWN